jgi:hypothetical protein
MYPAIYPVQSLQYLIITDYVFILKEWGILSKSEIMGWAGRGTGLVQDSSLLPDTDEHLLEAREVGLDPLDTAPR